MDRVQSGQPWKPPSAASQNAMVDAAEFHRRHQRLGLGTQLDSHRALTDRVKVKNFTGKDLPKGSVVEIFDLLIDKGHLSEKALWFEGKAPTLENVPAVIREPIPKDDWGEGQVTGAVIARVNVTDHSHKWTTVVEGSHVLQSGESGCHPIIWKPDQLGVQECVVRLCCPCDLGAGSSSGSSAGSSQSDGSDGSESSSSGSSSTSSGSGPSGSGSSGSDGSSSGSTSTSSGSGSSGSSGGSSSAGGCLPVDYFTYPGCPTQEGDLVTFPIIKVRLVNGGFCVEKAGECTIELCCEGSGASDSSAGDGCDGVCEGEWDGFSWTVTSNTCSSGCECTPDEWPAGPYPGFTDTHPCNGPVTGGL